MLTVAAVGKYLTDHWQGPEIDSQAIIITLLVHDLGNLVKFDLTEGAAVIEPELFTEEWRQRQQVMREKYGNKSHQATLGMIKEIGLSKKIQKLAVGVDANNICQIAKDSLDQQICEYADLRVTPEGVTDMETRIADLHRRYAKTLKWSDDHNYQENLTCSKEIQDRLQQHTSVDITEIPPQTIESYLVELARFELPTS